MTSSTSWKSSLSGPENMDTKTFTWRLRANLTQAPNHVELTSASNPTGSARNSKGLNSTVNRFMPSTAAGPSSSQSALNNLSSPLDPHNQQQFLRFQEFEIESGQSLGLHSMWSMFLVSCGSSSTVLGQRSNTNIATTSGQSSSASTCPTAPSANSDFVGLFLRKSLKATGHHHSGYTPSTKNDEIVIRYKLEIMDREGEVLYTKECESPAKSKLEVGYWDWKKIVPLWKVQSSTSKEKSHGEEKSLGGEDCLLLLRLTFTMVNRRKRAKIGKIQNPHEEELPSAEEVSVKEAANTFLNLVSNAESLQPNVIIDIPNRRKFFVHRRVLTARSSTFQKLLGSDINGKLNATVKVDDISANTMELVLKHIYTGQLEEEWTTNPVTATELIFASEKYWLPALKEFCNKHLVRAATKNNCYRLMEVAQLHNLEQAAEDLMSYVSEGISSNTNSRKPSEESVAIHD